MVPASSAAPGGATAAGAPDTPALRLQGLGRRYGERQVLVDVTLELPAGSTLLVLGHNGAGKSTLLRLLAGLLRPTAGALEVLGHPLPGGRRGLGGRIGWLGHQPLLHGDLTVRENLVHQARLHRCGPDAVDAALEATELVARAGQPVHALSAGLRRRADAARCLLHDPELLLLDEPLANLDPGAAERLGALLGPTRPDGDRTPRTRVLTSHDPVAALPGADVVLGLRGGRATLLGPARDVTDHDLRALYA